MLLRQRAFLRARQQQLEMVDVPSRVAAGALPHHGFPAEDRLDATAHPACCLCLLVQIGWRIRTIIAVSMSRTHTSPITG
ncbi:hypothetical protein WK26_13425 [Burkholderia vietnamiensis]|nr:hypothetical protein WJ21_07530 [Burkholderia vietnamiensis]KVR81062.1 hypothetical protein WK26_13425 [Burkholderia vietnamiensis]KVS27712.1 hypothetical protein WK35_14420 [Burkholderia vietnamiensis]